MKKKNNNLLLPVLVVLLLLIVIGGWYFLSLQKPVFIISTDKPAYFTTDRPVVEIKLFNAKNADSGRIDLEYDKSILKITERNVTGLGVGVQVREIDNKLIFELSKDYLSLSDKNPTIAKLTFEPITNGIVEFKLDKLTASLTSNNQNLILDELKNVEITVGIVPER